jgi:hypothetical protein
MGGMVRGTNGAVKGGAADKSLQRMLALASADRGGDTRNLAAWDTIWGMTGSTRGAQYCEGRAPLEAERFMLS